MIVYAIVILLALTITLLTSRVTEVRNPLWSGLVFAIFHILSTLVLLPKFEMFDWHLSVPLLAFALSLFPLLTYDTSVIRHNPSVICVASALFIGIATVFEPLILWLIPAYLVAMFVLRIFSLKTIVALVIGIITPLIWNGYNGMWSVDNDSKAITTNHQGIVLFILFLLFVVSSWHFYKKMYADKSRTRINYQILIIMGLSSLVLAFITLLMSLQSSLTFFYILLITTSILVVRMIDRLI
ncbi:MAG: hypothetical protein MJZ20_13425 [Bacteroidaceae bacterium]|nr:hypothetical protein [Bacteroidaceae bacterium]